jgi:membrane protein required for beta-lactamase induction
VLGHCPPVGRLWSAHRPQQSVIERQSSVSINGAAAADYETKVAEALVWGQQIISMAANFWVIHVGFVKSVAWAVLQKLANQLAPLLHI